MNSHKFILIMLCWLWALSFGTLVIAQSKGGGGGGKNSTPDPFVFVDQSGVALNVAITSDPITITGINTGSSISISGGTYSRNGGTFTNKKGTAYNGDNIRVRLTSANTYDTARSATLTVGGVSGAFTATTLSETADTTPDAFSLTAQSDVPLNTAITSNAITVSGINAPASISISGGQYAINGGAYTSAAGSVNNGNTVTVRLQSSSSHSTSTTATLTIGGVSAAFTVTTEAFVADTTPDAFSFAAQSDVEPGSTVTSNAINVTGINAPAPISISGGLYSVNNGSFVATAGEVNENDSVRVQLLASQEHEVTSSATLTIGGVSASFNVTTKTNSNGEFLLPPASSGNPAFTSEHFSGSNNCTMCHNNLRDENGQDASIETDWSSTMMANSARDPLWKAKVRSELNRNPHLADVINDKCTRCHAPMANFEARKKGEPVQILDGGFLSAGNARHNEAMNGVSCTVCHQIKNSPDLGTLSKFSGQYDIDGSKTIYGPYDDLFPNPMIMNTGYTPVYSEHTKSSKLCATCHNLKTPFVDEFGTVLSTTPESEFPEQMPYSEWEHSDFASATPRSCQQCHMSRVNGVPISNRPMWLQKRDDFALHEFVGGNKLMLDIFNNNKEQLGVLSNNFEETIQKTQEKLNNAATIQTVAQSLGNGALDFTLKINARTGHKLPSAYPSRRVVLHLTVKNAQGQVVFESGKINPNGSIEGVDADVDRTTFEPHYDLITSPDQVQVYEAIMGDSNGDVTYTLLRGAQYLKDNRLLPRGFDKATAPNDIKVVGEALNDPNFIGGSDEISYRISGLNGSTYTVEAELVHQPLAYSFAQDLFVEPDAEVQDFKMMFNASNQKTSRIVLHTFTVNP